MYIMPINNAQIVRKNTDTNFRANLSSTQIAVVKNEMETSFKPFLTQYEPIIQKGKEVLKSLSKKFAKIPNKNTFIPPQYVSKDILIKQLEQFNKNQNEYRYLKDKSKHDWAGEESKEYVALLDKVELFETPDFLVDSMDAFHKLKRDTKNGLQNMTMEVIAPKLYSKKNQLNGVDCDLDLAMTPYYSLRYLVSLLERRLSIGVCDEKTINNNVKEIQAKIRQIEKADTLEKQVRKATDIDERVQITEEDEEMVKNLYKPAQRVISRNVSRFKDAGYSLSETQHEQLGEILLQQELELKNLWEIIESGKKKYFSEMAKNNINNYAYTDITDVDAPF